MLAINRLQCTNHQWRNLPNQGTLLRKHLTYLTIQYNKDYGCHVCDYHKLLVAKKEHAAQPQDPAENTPQPRRWQSEFLQRPSDRQWTPWESRQ